MSMTIIIANKRGHIFMRRQISFFFTVLLKRKSILFFLIIPISAQATTIDAVAAANVHGRVKFPPIRLHSLREMVQRV